MFVARDDDDLVLLGPEIQKGVQPFIRKTPKGEVSTGVLSDEPETLENTDGFLELEHLGGPLYNVREDCSFTTPVRRSGPAQVASSNYRTGWDAVFGKTTVGQA